MIEYNWDPKEHIATCTIIIGTANYIGIAKCHQDDMDFESEKTGLAIAAIRARIKMLQGYIQNTLKPQYKALEQYYFTMKHSKNFNKDSYEIKMLYRRLRFIKKQLNSVKETIEYEKENLKTFINEKDKFYKKLREKRKAFCGKRALLNLVED